MRKVKVAYLLLGIGIGIILINGLYSIYPEVKYKDLNDEMIIERAKELGYISLKESLINGKEIKKGGKLEDVNQEEKAVIVEIRIEKGDNLFKIAEKLFETNLIDNKEEFIALAEDKMVDKRFSYGVFDIKYNTSYSTIIKLLTKE